MTAQRPDHGGAEGSLSDRMVRNSLWNTSGWLLLLILNLVSIPIMVETMGASAYSIVVLILSISAPMGLLDFGMTDATVKFLAGCLATGDRDASQRFVSTSMFFNLIVGVLGAVVLAGSASFIVDTVFAIPEADRSAATTALRWSALLWMATQIRQTPLGIVTALRRFNVLTVGTTVTQSAIVIGGIAALLLRDGDLRAFVAAEAGVAILATLVWYAVASRMLEGIAFRPAYHGGTLRRTTRFGFWQMISMLGGVMSQQSQRWLLGIMMNVITVGIYNVAIQLISTLYMVAFRIGQVLFPEVSGLVGSGRQEEAARVTVRSAWLVTLIAAGLYVPGAIFAPDLLRLWVGPELGDPAYPVVRVAALGGFVGCIFAVPSFYLLGTERVTWLAAMSVANGVLVLVACLLLVPPFGVMGAASSYVLGTAVHVFILVLLWRKVLRQWIAAAEYFAAMFSASAWGVLAVIVGSEIRDRAAGNLSLSVTLVMCGITGIVAVAGAAAADRFLPGGSERARALRSALRTAVMLARPRGTRGIL